MITGVDSDSFADVHPGNDAGKEEVVMLCSNTSAMVVRFAGLLYNSPVSRRVLENLTRYGIDSGTT